MKSMGILLVLAVYTVYMEELYPFQSFRVVQNATLYIGEVMKYIEDACQQIEKIKLPDIHFPIGDGITKQDVVMRNFVATDLKYNTSVVQHWESFDGGLDSIKVATKGNLIEFYYKFNWYVVNLGIVTVVGNGTFKVSTKGILYEQVLTKGVPKSNTLVYVDADLLTFTSNSKKASDMLKVDVENELNNQFYHVFENELNTKIPPYLDKNVWSNYNSMMMTLNKGMFVRLDNAILHTNIYKTNNSYYQVLMFDSNITIPGRPFHKKLWKTLYDPISTKLEDAEVCFNVALIPEIVDILGKGRYYYKNVTSEDLGLTMKLRQFVDIAPELINRYPEDMDVHIGCRPDISQTAVEIKVDQTKNMLQWPVTCTFVISSTGEEFLSSVVEFRAEYYPTSLNNITMKGLLLHPYVHSFKPMFKIANFNSYSAVYEILDRITKNFHDYELFAPTALQVPLVNLYNYKPLAPIHVNGTSTYCLSFDYRENEGKQMKAE